MKKVILTTLLLMVAALTAACGGAESSLTETPPAAEGENPAAGSAPAGPELAGSSWQARLYNSGSGSVVSVSSDAQITADFGEDGQLTGNAGCNQYNGPYALEVSKISIGPIASTRKACPDPIMTQESKYLAALETAAFAIIDGDTLELRTTDGSMAAEFRRSSE